MKNKEIITALLAVSGGFIVMSLTLFNNQIKLWLTENGVVVLFFFGLFLVTLSIIAIWVRLIFKTLFIEHYTSLNKEITDLRKKLDVIIESGSDNSDLSDIKNSLSRSLILRVLRFFI